MDFEDTPEEAAFRAEVRAWLDANAELKDPDETAPGIFEEEDDDSRYDISESQAWQAKKADAGWACITWPKEFGGRGGTPMESVIWSQEEGRYKVARNVFGIGLGMAGPTIMVHGTEEQKKKYIPKMIRGEEVWCQLFSEPGAGSDLAGLRTKAEKDGDEWVVNGQKIWTSGAHYCDWGILLTRTDPNVAKHKGLTFFIIDMKSPGIEIRPIKQITGGANFNEVFFDNLRIPDENRVDAVGAGWKVALTVLMNERMSVGSGAVGSSVKPDELFALAKECYVDGKPAIEDSATRQRIADFITRLKGMEFMASRTLTALSKGRVPGPEGSLSKLAMGGLSQEIAGFATELQGTMSSLVGPETAMEAKWQNNYLGIPGMRVAGGTDEIQRNIIGERILGLPGEPRLDKDKSFAEIPSGSR